MHTSRLLFAASSTRRKPVLHGGQASASVLLTDTYEYGADYREIGPGGAGSAGVPHLAATIGPKLGTFSAPTAAEPQRLHGE